ncbi:MAG: Mov34/MPN/PAD-1 family protein, partial [Anaerolineales bacterium]|nr:Mov34/MPN/PAD-1 family protein [Anaerolineales bacterium]
MTCIISSRLLDELSAHLEKAYPTEGAGFLLGRIHANGEREIDKLILLENNWPDGPRDDRFLRTPPEVLPAEE